jgi:hypothetical protein
MAEGRPSGAGLWLDVARATAELALARWRLGRRSARALIELAQRQGRPPRPAPPGAAGLAGRVAFVIPRVAARVPWRADCFVQALAAQSWLARSGVPSDLYIGVRRDRAPGLEAHAWLRHGDRIVTGGDVSGFVPLVAPDTPLPGTGARRAARIDRP